MSYERFKWEVRPLALPENIVKGKKYRFTLLTNRLIRMEYSENGCFEDRASQLAFYRDFPKTDFTAERNDGLLTIETDELVLKYKEDTEFSCDTMSVKLKNEPASIWHFGDDFEELGGTTRTLDNVDGARPIGKGVCSRFGFSVLNDSDSVVLGDDGWVEVRNNNTKDIYFFGYGYNYIDAVKDFYRLTSVPPMLPAYALGNWWSRYYKYTQEGYIALMERFKEEDIPFSVAVVDMDWHLVDIPEELVDEDEKIRKRNSNYYQYGWTGYTWNTDLFPDYKAFLKYLNENNLKTALNLHPAQGVRKFECMYDELARASGIDPKSGKKIPLDILSKEAMANYFDIIHHPYEEDGVDFWWMDWQQGINYWWIHEPNKDGKLHDPREKVDPLWMLNHLHILDISRDGKRPMFFSRFAGAGSHRYPVGFSGDTWVTWDSLKFQPYFTATASNIGYCWWSHDIGGHMWGYREDDLATRWIQLGVFSPINRLHSTQGEFLGKEAWNFGMEAEKAIGKWLRMRHRLFPYIYTMNYRCHKELLPLVQPMYYSYPKCSAAYEMPNQFWFGSELMVAPVTEPNGKADRLGRAEAWLPMGDWFDFESGLHYYSKRGRKMELFRDMQSYPVLAKAGAIVPMCSHYEHDNRMINDSNMEIIVFPGADNTFTLYEDIGDYNDYKDGKFATTEMQLGWGETAIFKINAAKGDLSLIPAERNWKVNLRGFNAQSQIEVTVDGKKATFETEICKESNTIIVEVSAAVTSDIVITVKGENLIHDNSDVNERIMTLIRKAQTSIRFKETAYKSLFSDGSIHDRLIGTHGNTSPDDSHIVKAIKELLTLTDEEFESYGFTF